MLCLHATRSLACFQGEALPMEVMEGALANALRVRRGMGSWIIDNWFPKKADGCLIDSILLSVHCRHWWRMWAMAASRTST